ncbi:MAG: type IV pilus modification PilV family protein [bacterium]
MLSSTMVEISKTTLSKLSKLGLKSRKHSSTFLSDQRGLTLIELLVVCVILAIAFIGLLGLFPLGSRNISESRLRTVATQLAQEKIEYLLNLSESSGDLTSGTHSDPENPIRSNFNRYWQVIDNMPVNGMKRIVVWVTYPHGSETREIRLLSQRRG